MRLDRATVAGRVLDDHDQPHRSLMVIGKELLLANVPSMHVLEVEQVTIDLCRQASVDHARKRLSAAYQRLIGTESVQCLYSEHALRPSEGPSQRRVARPT